MIKNSLGYIVTFKFKNGENGFIGIDIHSGGYPFFSNRIDTSRIRQKSSEAEEDLLIFSTMKSYFNFNEIIQDSIGVSEIFLCNVAVRTIPEIRSASILNKANKTFTKEELEILKKIL